MDNIKLDYSLTISFDENSYICPKGCEFFMDEHGIQWVKFRPKNGYHFGVEHIVRTDRILIYHNDKETYENN